MAMVLDAFASYLQGMLTEMAADEIHRLLGVSVEIDKMGDKLKDLKKFLADADKRNITDESVQGWVTELKRAMYDATDILDLCQLKAMERGDSSVDAGCFNPFLFCIRNPFHAHDIGSRIKKLNERLDTIKQRSSLFSFINLGPYEDRRRNMHASRHGNPNRETTGVLDQSGVVGEKIEEDTKALVAEILQIRGGFNNNIIVFAIVGVGGIGKTTLAQNVFNNESIQSEFDKKIWLSVNKNFDSSKLLRTAITLAGGKVSDGQEALAVLQPVLITALEGKKVLLVMDDLWSNGAWENLLKTPLVKAAASGSRVLITTRDKGVARGMTATLPHHHIDTLSPGDAWSLLKKQVLSSEADEYQVNMLKDVGLKIIQKCGGLPLAVKIMGGLLRQREMQRRDWEQVLEDAKWSMTKMPEDLNNAVYLSYEDMPPDLKQCFLYYSLLPKSIGFDDLHIIGMWISEGFIHGKSGDLEELGQKCYNELISRNLIELVEMEYGQNYCSMHDVVRSFGHYMAKSEALVAHSGEIDILNELNSKKFLRLSIETDEVQSGDFDWKSLQEQQSLRTLISNVKIKMETGDSVVISSSLRTLYVKSADVAVVESLHQLKHLRYLNLKNDDISALPGNIGKMKNLQYLDVNRCQNLVNLPDSIVKLVQLRYLNLPRNGSMIPRGFHGLTNMRILGGFPAIIDGDWCSLDELRPLSQLRFLRLVQLENASNSAANARISEKKHLINLLLYCTPRQKHNEDEQKQIETVFNELCPPSSIENIGIYWYFGQKLPSWMMSTATGLLNNLKFLLLSDLACCTQLPDGLCLLPCLQVLKVDGAPCIKRVGTEFLHPSQPAAASFLRLSKMVLEGMVEWEKWEWEEKVQAMPRLEELLLQTCKLRRVPPGLASNAKALRKLSVKYVRQLSCLGNFPFVVELTVVGCPVLERITDLPKLQKLTITTCPKLKVLNGLPALERVDLEDYSMKVLPEYAQVIKARHLQIFCGLWLLASVLRGDAGLQLEKFSQVEHVKAYARGGDNKRKWYVLYARDKCKLESNISSSKALEETLSSSMVDTQGFEHLYKMERSTFDHVCSLVREPFLDDMMAHDHMFSDGRVLSLQDRVAVALRLLNSGDTPETVGSSVGVNESTVSMVTKIFGNAMSEKASHYLGWPGSSDIEKIKYKFDEIHGLPNCCGVVHTDHFTFGSQNYNHEVNDGMLMQVVVDIDMRFTDIWLGSSGSMNQLSSTLHDSNLFKECDEGTWMNGSKLNLSDGWQVGEYIIGEAGYPLLPWLLTPYQEGNLLDCQVEFNRRHSKAMAVVRRALGKLKETWKFLHGGGWYPENRLELSRAIKSCFMLHNIVMKEECKAGTTVNHKMNHSQEVRQLSDEDAAAARDILSHHLTSEPSGCGGTLAIFEDAQRLECVLKMPRRTFEYVCSLLKGSSLEIMNSYFFFDMRFFSLEDRVAIALIMLNSGNPPATIGSSIGVNEATVSLITQTFADVMWERASYHLCWPDFSSEIEKIKYKFDKIHGLPNCCGVVHTAHFTFGTQKCDDEVNDYGMLIQAVVATDMRFREIWLGSPDSMNQSRMLQDSRLFKECEKGTRLNGSKLNLWNGWKVGEYMIGDVGYPLLPWLMTPCQMGNDLSDCGVVEFNRRHSDAMTVVSRALARLKDTWKFLHGETWHPKNQLELSRAIKACYILHNIVIDMECKAGTASYHKMSADEDVVVAVTDVLSQPLTSKPLESGDSQAQPSSCLQVMDCHTTLESALLRMIHLCNELHNKVIDFEGASMNDEPPMYDFRPKLNHMKQVRQLEDEDAARARDILSQHFLTSMLPNSSGTMAIFEDAERLESVLKMPRRTFEYVCSLLKESSLEIMNSYFFFDMRSFSLEERVAIALIMLNSGDPPATVGSFIGVNESTVLLATKSFVDAMLERAQHHLRWPQSDEMEKMKSMFDKIHGLPNCCGVLHTTRLTSASRSWDQQEKDSILFQGVVGPDMRFTSILAGQRAGNTSHSSFLHDSCLFKKCEKGARLNGSKLKVSSEEVGEYVIGDAGYPLLPWLLTPYELQNDLPDVPSYQNEFNMRHSAARNIALKAIARLEDTWKFMHGEWRPDNPHEMTRAIRVCCRLHNIVIGMEEGAAMPSDQDVNYSDQVRQLADEDAVRMRDILSQPLLTSISSHSKEEQQEIVASSGSGDRAKCEAREEKRC